MRTFYYIRLLCLVCLLFPFTVSAQTKSIDNIRKSLYKKTQEVNREAKKVERDKNSIDRLSKNKDKYLPESKKTKDSTKENSSFSIIEKLKIGSYSNLFTLLNGKRKLTFNDVVPNVDTVLWDSLHQVYYKKKLNLKVLTPNQRNVIWFPYWEDNAYQNYDYNLVSDFIFYAYNIDPLSGFSNDQEGIEAWKSISLVDSAHAYGKKVYLSSTLYSEESVHSFLSSYYAQEVYIDSISSLVEQKNADGVSIDFNPLTKDNWLPFVTFIKKLNRKLKEGDAASKLILNLPARALDVNFEALDEMIHFYIVMNYANDESASSRLQTMQPSFALSSKEKGIVSMSSALSRYESLNIHSKKIVFNLYDYINRWDKTNDSLGYFKELGIYSDLVELKKKSNKIVYDSILATNYLEVENAMYWFENEKSLTTKLSWLVNKKAGGVAFWTLLADASHKPFWSAIETSLTMDSVEVVEPIKSKSTIPYRWTDKIMTYRPVIISSLFVLFLASVLGVLFSLGDWRVRELFFQKKFFRYLYVSVALASLSLYLWLYEGLSGDMFYLVFGFVFSFIVFLFVNILSNHTRKKTP